MKPHEEKDQLSRLWLLAVTHLEEDDPHLRGIGSGLMIAVVTMGFDPAAHGWEKNIEGKWVR